MKYAFFLGCTIPARSRNYEISARKVAEKLGIDLVDVDRFICCGFPLKASDQKFSEILAGYNIALAQSKGLDIVTLCSSCSSALTEVEHDLSHNPALRDRVNEHLLPLGLEFTGNARIRHFARVLFQDIGPDCIKKHLEKDLSGLKIAVHYGCHYLKPSTIYEGFDEVEAPMSIDTIVAATGAEVLDYPGKKNCCGGPVLPVDEKVALSVAKQKLDSIAESGADAICLVCPFCSVMYDGNQKSIESEHKVSYGIPVLYLTQVLGLAMGFDKKELGLSMNVVKTKELLANFL